MSTYEIQGTVSLFMEKDKQLKIRLTPANGYVCPNKKYAVFFPFFPIEKKSVALMRKIKEKVVELELLSDDDMKKVFLYAASAQKSIRLEVEETPNKEKTLIVVGFTYPVSQ